MSCEVGWNYLTVPSSPPNTALRWGLAAAEGTASAAEAFVAEAFGAEAFAAGAFAAEDSTGRGRGRIGPHSDWRAHGTDGVASLPRLLGHRNANLVKTNTVKSPRCDMSRKRTRRDRSQAWNVT
eukprot:760390-Rhodomonas_salina.2